MGSKGVRCADGQKYQIQRNLFPFDEKSCHECIGKRKAMLYVLYYVSRETIICFFRMKQEYLYEKINACDSNEVHRNPLVCCLIGENREK